MHHTMFGVYCEYSQMHNITVLSFREVINPRAHTNGMNKYVYYLLDKYCYAAEGTYPDFPGYI